jgi:hypothetical protein
MRGATIAGLPIIIPLHLLALVIAQAPIPNSFSTHDRMSQGIPLMLSLES